MIIRLIAIDPAGSRPGTTNDCVVYQVPENSRELEVLKFAFEKAGIQFVEMEPTKAKPRKVPHATIG